MQAGAVVVLHKRVNEQDLLMAIRAASRSITGYPEMWIQRSLGWQEFDMATIWQLALI